MYICNGCGNQFEDEPCLSNGRNHARHYCRKCVIDQRIKAAATMKARRPVFTRVHDSNFNICTQCGERFDKSTKSHETRCRDCAQMIMQINKCLAHGPRLASLVAKYEIKAAEIRNSNKHTKIDEIEAKMRELAAELDSIRKGGK